MSASFLFSPLNFMREKTKLVRTQLLMTSVTIGASLVLENCYVYKLDTKCHHTGEPSALFLTSLPIAKNFA